MIPPAKRRLRDEEYLAIERVAEGKSEFIDRVMCPLAPAGPRHARVVGNLFASLHRQFRGRKCEAHMSGLRVRVGASGLYAYPDLVAFTGEPRVLEHDPDTLTHPQIIVEVLSPGTEGFDRGEKFRRYRELESLTDYVLVAQERMLVEQWRRQTRDLWTVLFFNDPADGVRFETPQGEVTLGEIYQGVDLGADVPLHLR